MDRLNLRNLKAEIHRTLLAKLDLEKLGRVGNDRAREATVRLIQDIFEEDRVPLSAAEKQQLQGELLDEVFGLGPLEPLLRDPSISDILVNRWDKVFIERSGRLYPVPDTAFRDDDHLMQIIQRIVAKVGRRIDEMSPMVDARLEDGSRVNAIIPPLALDGPSISIRRFGSSPVTIEQMLEWRCLSPEMFEVLKAAVKARVSMLISGGTGSGKTTFLNMLSKHIPNTERLVTIEDAAELQIPQDNVVRLETRPANIEGQGAIRQRQLVINSLRMRPDRIIIGEVRGDEAFDMLQAMNTGHEGSMTTIHANSPRDAIARLESMIAMANLQVPEKAVRQQIASAITIVLQLIRQSDGTRKLVKMCEITGMEQDLITMQDVFSFQRKGVGHDGKIVGSFEPSRIRPKFIEQIRMAGIALPSGLFERAMEVA
jgi:pilus assembly protein CpaF